MFAQVKAKRLELFSIGIRFLELELFLGITN